MNPITACKQFFKCQRVLKLYSNNNNLKKQLLAFSSPPHCPHPTLERNLQFFQLFLLEFTSVLLKSSRRLRLVHQLKLSIAFLAISYLSESISLLILILLSQFSFCCCRISVLFSLLGLQKHCTFEPNSVWSLYFLSYSIYFPGVNRCFHLFSFLSTSQVFPHHPTALKNS